MKRIVMDTNFIMEVAKNKIDLARELKRVIDFPHTLFIIEGSSDELKRIMSEQKGKEREAAKLATLLTKEFKTLKGEGKNVDEKLANLSDKDTIIATQDKGLKKKIKCQIIVVRQKKYLQLI